MGDGVIVVTLPNCVMVTGGLLPSRIVIGAILALALPVCVSADGELKMLMNL